MQGLVYTIACHHHWLDCSLSFWLLYFWCSLQWKFQPNNNIIVFLFYKSDANGNLRRSTFQREFHGVRCHEGKNIIAAVRYMKTGIILCMRSANERRRYIVTSSLIDWVHTHNDPWKKIATYLQIFWKEFSWMKYLYWQSNFAEIWW